MICLQIKMIFQHLLESYVTKISSNLLMNQNALQSSLQKYLKDK
jgi:hypothetical protein